MLFFENPFRRKERKKSPEGIQELTPEEIKETAEERNKAIERVLSEKNIKDEEILGFLRKKLSVISISIEEGGKFENEAGNYVDRFIGLRKKEEYKNLSNEILWRAIEAGQPERYLRIYQKVYEQIKQQYPEVPDWFLNLADEAIREHLNKNLEDEQIITLVGQGLKESMEKPLTEIVDEATRHFPEESTTLEEGESPKETIPTPEVEKPKEPDLYTRLSWEVPRNEVIRILTEASVKIGELIRRLYSVNYSPGIMRRIIFADDQSEADRLLNSLRQGEYNIPATIWRRSGLAELFHRLGIKVETKNPFEQMALLCEKGMDIKKALDELMGKIREIEEKAETMSEEELKNLLERLKVIPDELKSLENAISCLEAYFGKVREVDKVREVGISRGALRSIWRILSGLGSGLGTSFGLLGISIGLFLPLWFIAYTAKQAEGVMRGQK